MAYVYKKTRSSNGVNVKRSKYTCVYRDPSHPRGRRQHPGYRDKAASLALAQRLERDAERRAVGLAVVDDAEASQPWAQHSERYIADLRRRGRSAAYLIAVRKALEKTQRECV